MTTATIQQRGDVAANWTSVNPTLAEREMGIETDTKYYKIGDGVTTWNNLSYSPLSSSVTLLTLTGQSSDPAAPAAGNLEIYAKAISHRMMLKHAGPSGLTTAIQPFLARNKVGYWCPQGNSTSVPGILGYTPPTTLGTATIRNVAVTNTFTRMRRLGYVSATTAGSLTYGYNAAQQYSLGDGAGNAGFHKIMRWGISDAAFVTGARCFMGMSVNVSTPTNVEPSTLTYVVGMGHGAADTTMHMYYGGTTAQTPIDLGSNFPCNTISADPYELALFSPSNQAGYCYYEVTNIGSGHVATGVLYDTSGTGVTFITQSSLMTNIWWYRANNTTAKAVGVDIMSDYIETDN